ncbi:GPW/gp25 family protein [Nocardioides sp. GCM10028917]|uniref:GPW/gp25 family protein n=1 Tax=Nocardioides sp. GCM10028917 TaxID=3273408 RepID=UPI003610C4E0
MIDTTSTPAGPSFLGTGWAFPISLDASGSVAVASAEDDVRQSIRIILGTNLGERAMRPDFGSGIRAFVFEAISTTTLTLLRTRVEDALVRWEPRIRVERVEVALPSRASSQVNISVDYRVRATNTFYNLVYPFYLEEGDRG